MAFPNPLSSLLPNRQNVFADEDTLVTALYEGQQRAFACLYETEWPIVRNYVLQQKGDDDDAKEVFHVAMIRLVEQLRNPQFTLTAKVGTYLFSIVKYAWWSENRKRGKHVAYKPDPIYTESDDTDNDPLDGLGFIGADGIEQPYESDDLPDPDELLV